jgi:hypothetical protein
MGPNWLFFLGMLDAEEEDEEAQQQRQREGDDPRFSDPDDDEYGWDAGADEEEDPNSDIR